MTATKTKPIKIPPQKIAGAVKRVLPRGRTLNVKVEDSALGGMKIVRVVTTAWKDLRPAERISRVRGAVEQVVLSRDEQDKILRFSVLTPDEYKSIWNDPQRRAAQSAKRLKTRRTAIKAGPHSAKSAASGERRKLVENGVLASKPTS
jgi:hypothetical protein